MVINYTYMAVSVTNVRTEGGYQDSLFTVVPLTVYDQPNARAVKKLGQRICMIDCNFAAMATETEDPVSMLTSGSSSSSSRVFTIVYRVGQKNHTVFIAITF